MADTTDIRAEPVLNKNDDTLPFGYFDPKYEGKLTWICGHDAQGKITSVLCMDLGTEKDKKCGYIENMEQAKNIRDELIKSGWQKLKTPDIVFKLPNEKESRKLNRKERRYLKKKVDKLKKQNPFQE